MKQLCIFLSLIFVLSCSTRKVRKQKSQRVAEFEQLEESELKNSQSVVELKTVDFSQVDFFGLLESVPDSTGIYPNLTFTHIKNGEVVEEIKLEGGRLITKTESKSMNENTSFNSEENYKFSARKEVDGYESEVNSTNDKKIETHTLSFWAWFWLGIALLLIIVLIALKRQLKGFLGMKSPPFL